MDRQRIQYSISTEMWNAINMHYTNFENSLAVQDAINYMRDLIRDISGYSNYDGRELISDAMDKNDPKLIFFPNSEAIQEGYRFFLYGIFSVLRNPIIHHHAHYNRMETDQIIPFIDFLCEKIKKSDHNFSIEKFMQQIDDAHFIDDYSYLEALFEQIPEIKYSEVLEVVFYEGVNGSKNSISTFKNFFGRMPRDIRNPFYKKFSSHFRSAGGEKLLRLLEMYPPQSWSEIDKISRLRVEKTITDLLKTDRIIRIDDIDTKLFKKGMELSSSFSS